jgi:polyisoprenoid-binding protein YceI
MMNNNTGNQTQTSSMVRWTLDPAHSEVTFKVKHMMITSVTGQLTDYTLDVMSQGDGFSNAQVVFVGRLTSITTANEQRDTHLKSADFFDIEKNPEVTFRSTNYTKDGDDITLEGDLTIRGITKRIVLDVEYGGMQKDPWGNTKAGFSVKGKINRKDFGLNWNAMLETGGVLVGDEVKINCEIELIQQKEDAS